MGKLKQKIKDVFGYIVVGLGAIVGILVYLYKGKQKDINALKAQIDLAETQKQADLVEVQIKEKQVSGDLLKKEVQELEKASEKLADKRKEIAATEASKSEQEALDSWNDKK